MIFKRLQGYLIGGIAVISVASCGVAVWAMRDADHQRELRRQVEQERDGLNALEDMRRDFRAWDAVQASWRQEFSNQIASLDLTQEPPVYVTPPTADCPSPSISTVRLRQNADDISALLRSAPGSSRESDGRAATNDR